MVDKSKCTDVERIIILMEEIAILKSRIKPQATGHLYTAINVIEERVFELQDKVEKELRNAH
tara:strand:- start:236 stop:421 length:186 start_codon:yes stop_codon:yes gene_type:complete